MDVMRFLLALILLVGAAVFYIVINPPIVSEQDYPAAYEQVFEAVQVALQISGYPARIADKGSGLIDTDWRPLANSMRARANVLVQRVQANTTKVRLNLLAEQCALGQLICNPNSSFKNADYQALFRLIGQQMGLTMSTTTSTVDVALGLKTGSAGFLAITGEQYFLRYFSFSFDAGVSAKERYGILGKVGGGFRWFPITKGQYLPLVEVYIGQMKTTATLYAREVSFTDIGAGVGLEIRFGKWNLVGELGFVITSTSIENNEVGEPQLGPLFGISFGYRF